MRHSEAPFTTFESGTKSAAKRKSSLNYQQKLDSGSLPSGLIANWQMDGFNGSNEVVDVVSGRIT